MNNYIKEIKEILYHPHLQMFVYFSIWKHM